MNAKEYDGKKFIVTISRNTMQRGYVLSTIESDGSFLEQNEPLYADEFREYYGFSPEWPYEIDER